MNFVDILLSGLVSGGIYALVAVGLNLQYGIARIMNLAYGEVSMLAAFLTCSLFLAHGVNPFLTLLVGLPAAFAANLAVYYVFLVPLLRRAPNQAALEADCILATFGLMFALQGVALLSWGGTSRSYSFLAHPVDVGGTVIGANRLVVLVAAVGIGGLVYLALTRTRIGTALRAIAVNPQAAPLVAIDVRRYSGYAFAAGGALAAAAGVLISTFFSVDASVGIAFTLKALIVVIMGGIGNVLGGIAAGLLLGVAENLGAYFLDSALIVASNFAAFMLVLLFRPQGLFGRS